MFIMFIEFSYAYALESRSTRNSDDSLGSGTKLLLPSLSLGFWHEERETQFFYADCSSIVGFQLTDPTNARAHPAVHKLPGLAQVRKINSFRLSKSQLTAFIQNHSESQPIASGHDVIHIPNPISYLGFLLWHLRLSHSPRAHVNTCVNVCTYTCTKPKGSKPY